MRMNAELRIIVSLESVEMHSKAIWRVNATKATKDLAVHKYCATTVIAIIKANAHSPRDVEFALARTVSPGLVAE